MFVEVETVHTTVVRQHGINDGRHYHLRCGANLAAVHERKHDETDGISFIDVRYNNFMGMTSSHTDVCRWTADNCASLPYSCQQTLVF